MELIEWVGNMLDGGLVFFFIFEYGESLKGRYFLGNFVLIGGGLLYIFILL